MKQRFLYILLVVVFVGVSAGGCGQDVGVSGDSTNAVALCKSYYQQCVDPIFYKYLSRTDGAVKQCIECHQGGPGKSFQLPLDPNAVDYWSGAYETARNMSLDGLSSKLLLKPLGQLAHGGGQFFVNTADLDYLIINKWISNPDPQNQVGDFDYNNDTAFCKTLFVPNTCL